MTEEQTAAPTSETPGESKPAPTPGPEANGAESTELATTPGGITLFDGATAASWDLVKQKARDLAGSDLLPDSFRGKPANVLVAMEMAARLRMSPFQVMQNLVIVHGQPTWFAKFLIATVNGSGQFSRLRFKFIGTKGQDDWGCIASATDRRTGEVLEGAEVTIGLAKAEGWYDKKGSKWKTMPDQMLRYRAAAFWTRIYAPELVLGVPTAEETHDVHSVEVLPAEAVPKSGPNAELEARLRARGGAETVDPETGEITGGQPALDAAAGEVPGNQEP